MSMKIKAVSEGKTEKYYFIHTVLPLIKQIMNETVLK